MRCCDMRMKENKIMKMISRRDFMKASAVVGAAGVLTACGGSSSSTASATASSAAASSEAASGESVELIVFAAASLTETLNAIAETYSAENPGEIGRAHV